MTSDQLAAIEARLRAATPGPWTWTKTTGRQASREFLLGQFEGSDGPDLHGTGVGAPGKTVEESCLSTAITGNGPTSEANAIFIANAPTDIAALIAEIARLREALRQACTCVTCNGAGEIDVVTGYKDNGPNDPIEVYELDECPECAGQKIGSHVEEATARVLEGCR